MAGLDGSGRTGLRVGKVAAIVRGAHPSKTAKGEAAKSGGGAEVGQPHLIEASQKPKLAHHNITNKFRLPGRGTMVRRVSTGKPGGVNLVTFMPRGSSLIHT